MPEIFLDFTENSILTRHSLKRLAGKEPVVVEENQFTLATEVQSARLDEEIKKTDDVLVLWLFHDMFSYEHPPKMVNRWILWTMPSGGLQAISVKTYPDETDESILRGVMEKFIKYEYFAKDDRMFFDKYPITGT